MAFRFVPTSYAGSKNANSAQQVWRPPSTDLQTGEIAVNLADGTLFLQPSSGNAVQFASLDSNGYVPLTQTALSGVTAGTYTKLVVDVRGRVTAGSLLTSTDVTNALSYIPVKSVNQLFPDNNGNINLSGSNYGTVSQQIPGVGNGFQVDVGTFISAKYFMQIVAANGNGTEIMEFSLVQDGGNNVTMTTYGTTYVGTTTSLCSISASCNNGTVTVVGIPLGGNTVTVSYTRTYFSS